MTAVFIKYNDTYQFHANFNVMVLQMSRGSVPTAGHGYLLARDVALRHLRPATVSQTISLHCF